MPEPTPSNLYPSLSYDDAAAAIEWLCDVLGFRKRLIVPGPDGTVVHSELSLGPGVVMVGSPRDDDGRSSPKRLGGVTAALSIQCDDPDAVFERVAKAGWEILHDLQEEDHDARGFMTRDPGGQQWYVGTYRPGEYWDGASVDGSRPV